MGDMIAAVVHPNTCMRYNKAQYIKGPPYIFCVKFHNLSISTDLIKLLFLDSQLHN
jgi:hypothetical protein